jgi:signal transduction histidine kinase
MVGQIAAQAGRVAEKPWFGYPFGVAAVMLTALALELSLAQTRLGNASTLFTIPVLVTAALSGRGPAVLASAIALLAFELRQMRLGNEPDVVAPVVFLLTALIVGQLAGMLRQQARRAQQRERESVALQQLGATLLQEHEFDRVLEEVSTQLQGLTQAEGVALLLLDEQEGVFEVRTVVGPGASAYHGTRVPVAASFAGDAVRTNTPQRSDAARDDPRATTFNILSGSPPRSVLSVPMRTRRAVIGAISLYNKRSAHGFSDRDAELAMLFAQQASVAIENARLYEETRGKAALEERQRLARELHDSVSQQLYGIALNASTAEELFDSAPERARGLLGDVLRLAEAGLAEMRALIFELRPESLEQEGLIGALEKQAAAVRARHGLEVRLSAESEPDVPQSTKEVLYRVAQEALHNTTKHARAHHLDLVLKLGDAEVALMIADDGRGFDPNGEFPGHLGLRSMRERAAAVGGALEITSAPGAGTRLYLRVPITARSA